MKCLNIQLKKQMTDFQEAQEKLEKALEEARLQASILINPNTYGYSDYKDSHIEVLEQTYLSICQTIRKLTK